MRGGDDSWCLISYPQAMKPESLVHSFELIYFYDELLGHWMWYLPLYTAYTVYFSGCFISAQQQQKQQQQQGSKISLRGWLLAMFSAGFECYLVTEGQIFPLFTLHLVAMLVLVVWRWHWQAARMDCNAQFLLGRGLLVLVGVACWVAWLWDDGPLRAKYPGWLYIPEPWSYISLYVMKL